MDLLGDIGAADQLTSTREENRVLQAKVKELTLRVHELKAENEALKAEVEIYREDYAKGTHVHVGAASARVDGEGGGERKEDLVDDGAHDFLRSGDGTYPADPVVTLPDVHGAANPLCCALHPDDTLLATGGADSNLKLCRWGAALAPGDGSSAAAVEDSIVVSCGAPVICCAFARANGDRRIVAAGCMDGSVKLAHCGLGIDAPEEGRDRVLKPSGSNVGNGIKHERYVKTICWSPTESILASASADGTVQLTSVNLDETNAAVSLEVVRSFHFDAAVESMCFVDHKTLCCYVRGTSYLTYFDFEDDYKQRKVSLNGSAAGTVCFDDHVSFAVLSLVPSPNGEYIAAATDASRNIILKAGTDKIVRNLYGHKNDGFSNPKIAWSSNGQYLYGNSQDENDIYVWDIASSSIVKRLEGNAGGHTSFVRDIFSSCTTDTLASISFDKSAKIWLCEM